jgi:hypothetical protein
LSWFSLRGDPSCVASRSAASSPTLVLPKENTQNAR